MRQVYGRPVCLAVAPSRATTPGPLGQLALQLGGFHIRAYPGKRRSRRGSQTSGNWEQLHTKVRPWR